MPILVPCATFTSVAAMGDHLSASQIFSSVALLNMLIFPINAYPWIINGLVEAWVSLCRIAAVLEYDYEAEEVDIYHNESTESRSTKSGFHSGGGINRVPAAIHLSNTESDWGQDEAEDSYAFRIGPISLHLEPRLDGEGGAGKLKAGGQVWAVCGGVGCGKTSMLLSLLGETRLLKGRRGNLRGIVSYCPQPPSLFEDSVRGNILLGHAMVSERYQTVIRGTGLDEDMSSASWSERGDLVYVGPGGGRLSGGQRLRVGVARALYSSAPIVLLDDPFSALDPVTAASLLSFLRDAANGFGEERSRLIIIATHSVHLLEGMDGIILMENGAEVCRGTFQSLLGESDLFRSLLSGVQCANVASAQRPKGDEFVSTNQYTSEPTENSSITEDVNINNNSEKYSDVSRDTMDEIDASDGGKKGIDEEDVDSEVDCDGRMDEIHAKGTIQWSVICSYFSAIGWPMMFLVVVSMALMQCTNTGSMLLWAWWADRQDSLDTNSLFIVVGVITSAVTMLALIRSLTFAIAGLVAATKLYSQLTTSVIMSPLCFFEGNPTGRILNRFSRDTFNIDDKLPFTLNITLAMSFSVFSSCAVICASNYPVIGILLLVSLIYYQFQRLYRGSSRQLRRLQATIQSKLLALLTDCMSAGPSIRAQGLEGGLKSKLEEIVDAMTRVLLSSTVATLWLTLRMQLLGAVVTSSLALSSCLTVIFGLLPVAPGVLGLALTYSLTVVNSLSALMSNLTEVELEMVSVERVAEYTSLPPEDFLDAIPVLPQSSPEPSYGSSLQKRKQSDLTEPLLSNRSPVADMIHQDVVAAARSVFLESWPLNSAIVFQNMCLSYGAGSTLALNNLNLDIKAGSRVAIVGRTGSGKSSIFRALLRLTPYSGSVHMGGLELRNIPRHIVRSRICVVPQDPVLFTGTVRMNMDPESQYCDAKVFWALERCGLVDTLAAFTQNKNELV